MRYFIFGSGPAGLGMAKSILKTLTKSDEIYIIENRILTGGLFRTGVAPDHIEIR